MSTKQLAQSVRHGRKVTFQIYDGEPITGYLGGMDEEYFYVLTPEEGGYRRLVILRAGSPAFELHAESTYEVEPQREAMEEIIRPFRGFIMNRIFGNGSDSEARSKEAV